MRVLVTGAAGSIGRVVCVGLATSGHMVRGVDLREPGHDVTDACAGDVLVGDCAERAVADAAVHGVGAVVHLAGNPGEAPLPVSLSSHVVVTAALLDAMVRHGVGRILYASSNHAVGMTERTGLLGTDVWGRPDTFYGVGKVAAEALLSLYVDRHAISAAALRIGSFGPRPTSRRQLSTWLSPGDCVAMMKALLAAPDFGMAVVWGVSANTRGWWDLAPGRALGYDPVDDAESFASEVPEGRDDDAEGARVGGDFALPPLPRPALP